MRIAPLFFAVMVLTVPAVSGQTLDSLNQGPSPIGGVERLALEYYRIDFSENQRSQLRGKRLEFIYLIDEYGKPTLEEVNGIDDQDILDSLFSKSPNIPQFNPRVENGVPMESLYFLQLTFPAYGFFHSLSGYPHSSQYREANLEDFEYITKSNARLDILFGGMVNQFIGSPTAHLGTGGGMKIDMDFTSKKHVIFGFQMGVYGNRLKREYPLQTNREQLSAPMTILLGVALGKWFPKASNENTNLNLRFEVNYAIQNVTERVEENDPDWVQLRGFSPGVVLNYAIQLGRDRMTYYYGAPSIYNHNLNLHFGVRPIFFNLKEASGLMLELGVSYRMAYQFIKEYKLKSEFLERGR